MFVATAKDGTEIHYRDGKRFLYLSAVFFPVIPTLSVLLYFTSIGVWATLIPFAYLYMFAPIVDAIIGEDTHNPPDEVMPAMASDRFYNWMVRAAVPMLWISFVATVLLIGTQDLPWWSILALVVGAGSVSGNSITIGHELGHKNNNTDQRFAMWANAVVGYAHFRVEHNHGHHVLVSTPEDPASSQMGETIYSFVLREIPGALKNGWSFEANRLRKKGKSVFSPDNELLQGWAITLTAAAILVALLGWMVAPFILVHHMFGWYGLTQANYVEHYGLLREKRENGRYEPCRPHHSWNTNHTFSNLITFHLQRHSDHHSNPMRPYQTLRDFPDLPRLPSGYPGMFALAAFPPLFFKVMDPKVMDWAGGDFSKVNVLPAKRKQLVQRWSQPAHVEPSLNVLD
ncbi:MAG: alkane 1-monooxygenase [Erythrobacter sp.]